MKHLKYLFVFVFFSLVASFKFAPAFNPETSNAFYGDGWGTIGWIYDIQTKFAKDPISMATGDYFQTDDIGGGLRRSPQPTSVFWKVFYGASGYFLSPDDAYDIAGIVGFILLGVSGFFLGQCLSLNFGISIFIGMALVINDNFIARLQGHITFTHYYMPVIVLGLIYKLCEGITLRRLIGLSFALAINFTINEYYGYFTTFAALSALVPLLIAFANANRIKRIQLLKWSALSAFSLIALLSLFYPNLIGSRILGVFVSKTAEETNIISNFSHLKADFYNYGVKTGWHFISNRAHFLNDVLPGFFKSSEEGGESTMRVGFVITLVAFFSLVFGSKISKAQKYVILTFTLIGISLSLRPSYDLSLARVTMTIAPMFRCSIRALLLAQIGMIALFAIGIQNIWEQSKLHTLKGIGLRGASIILCYMGFLDIGANRRLLDTFPHLTLFSSPVYTELAKQPDGAVIEFPLIFLGKGPEAEYIYYLNRRLHHKPVINGFDIKFAESKMDSFFRINSVPFDLPIVLAKAGVRYIVATNREGFDIRKFDHLENLELIAEGSNTESQRSKVFRVLNSAEKFDRQEFKALLHSPKELIFDANHFDHTLAKNRIPILQTNPIPILISPGQILRSTTTAPLEPGRYKVKAEIESLDDPYSKSINNIVRRNVAPLVPWSLAIVSGYERRLESTLVFKQEFDPKSGAAESNTKDRTITQENTFEV
ncbi:MAG: hypothetical protein NT027_13190, partial [Proteobacteria bacterium]|nr:hypothetical protein [Pseudomonadota bacterium]